MGRHIPENKPMNANQMLAQGQGRGPLDLGDRWQEFTRSFERSRHRLFCDITAIFAILMFITALGAIAAPANAGEVWFLAALGGTWAGSAVVVCYLIKRVRIPHGPGLDPSGIEGFFHPNGGPAEVIATSKLCGGVLALYRRLAPAFVDPLKFGLGSTKHLERPGRADLKVIAFILLAAICGWVVWWQRTSRRTKSFAELWRDYWRIDRLMKGFRPGHAGSIGKPARQARQVFPSLHKIRLTTRHPNPGRRIPVPPPWQLLAGPGPRPRPGGDPR